jgi:hypothetical protein
MFNVFPSSFERRLTPEPRTARMKITIIVINYGYIRQLLNQLGSIAAPAILHITVSI